MEESFEVECFGGPDDGSRKVISGKARHGWEVWQPLLMKGGFGAKLIGSYIVEPNRTRASWVEVREWFK